MKPLRQFLFLAALAGLLAAGRAAIVEGDHLSLTAPAGARTASSVLLLWDRPAGAAPCDYEVVCNGMVVTHTPDTHAIVSGLEAARDYRFSVREAVTDRAPLASAVVQAATRPRGPVLNVRARGAKGDGREDDTVVIQEAIDACPSHGTVYFPAGEYRTGPLRLKSDLTLELAAGSTLRFRERAMAPVTEHTLALPGPDGPVDVPYGALLTGLQTDNVALIGAGTISGCGESWWPHAAAYRPKLFEVIGAKNLFVQGVTFEDPPFWSTHPIYIDGVVFAGVTFLKRSRQAGTNGDGLNPDSCRDVLIVGCRFGNQDDSIAIKSGKLTPAQTRRQRACEDIEIRDCRFDGKLAPGSHPLGLAIGSETCGGVRRVRMHDCTFVDAASLANIKTNRERRFAVVEDVLVEDCTYVNQVFPDEPWNRAPIVLDQFYYGRPGEDPDKPQGTGEGSPAFRNIRFRNLTIENPPGRAIYLSGLGENPLRGIAFEHVTATAKTGLFARNIDGLVLDDVAITPATGPAIELGVRVTRYHGPAAK